MAGAEGADFQQFLSEPFLFEPEYTNKELWQMDANREEAATLAAAQLQE